MKWLKASFSALVALTVAACGNSNIRVAPENIQPVYQVRNAPIPVPRPNFKPKAPNKTVARTAVVTQRDQSQPQPSTSSGSVTVRRGDTVYAISRRTGVQVRSLITFNSLKAPYLLQPGQKLGLPKTKSHMVKRGETGYGISRQYGVQVSELMRINKIRAPYRLSVGQSLFLPAGSSAASSASTPSQTVGARPTRSPGSRAAPLTVPPRSGSDFSWPIRGSGQIVSRYGPKQGGLHNDGVNIRAAAGTAVVAAEDGVVAYASNQLPGYGNMILLKHADGWITAYAHNESLSVDQGQQVSRNQVIARVGSTGGVRQPQLHFEIRKGRRALDPLRYLRRPN